MRTWRKRDAAYWRMMVAKRQEALALRRDGDTIRGIAESLGVEDTTVNRWISPKYAAAANARAKAGMRRLRDRQRQLRQNDAPP